MHDVTLNQTLFQALPPEERTRLAKTLRVSEYPAGSTLFREGEKSDRLYILVAGRIAIVKGSGQMSEQTLAVCEPGSFLGEMGLFERESKRSATARTLDRVEVLEMDYAELERLLRQEPTLAYEMIRVLSSRLHQLDNNAVEELRDKNLALTSALHELGTAQAQLVEQKRLERELELARDIQRSILPRRLPELPGFEFAARMLPAHTVGGDFFDFIRITPKITVLVIGDVSGSGVPAALFMALTCTLMRAEAAHGDSLLEGVRNVNRQLLEINDAGMFVSAWIGLLDGETRELHYVCAGHEVPFFCGAGGIWKSLPRTTGLPLGTTEDILLDQQSVRFAAGSLLIGFTDGLTDTVDASGERFGMERLRTVLSDSRDLRAPDLCEHLLGANAAFRGDVPQLDDIALIAVHAI